MTRQDRAYTMDIVHEKMRLFEEDWEACDGKPTLKWILTVMFFLTSCLGGMRGFEVVWTDLGALLYEIARLEE